MTRARPETIVFILFSLRSNVDVSLREWVRHHGCMAVGHASQHDDDVFALMDMHIR